MPLPFMLGNSPGIEAAGAGGPPPDYLAIAPGQVMAWWRGDTGLPNSGGIATGWTDQSGNGKNLTAYDSPPYSASAWKGKGGVNLSGAGGYFMSAQLALDMTSVVAFWVFASARLVTGANEYARLVTLISDVPSIHDYQDPNGGIPLVRDYLNANIQTQDANNLAHTTSTPISYDTDYHFGAVYTATQMIPYLGGVAQTPVAATRSQWGRTGMLKLTIGVGAPSLQTDGSGVASADTNFGQEWWKGPIGNVVVGKGTLTPTQIAAFETYENYRETL